MPDETPEQLRNQSFSHAQCLEVQRPGNSSRAVGLSACGPLVLSACRSVGLWFSRPVVLWASGSLGLSFCGPLVLSACRSVGLWFSRPVGQLFAHVRVQPRDVEIESEVGASHLQAVETAFGAL
ncbi:unnamed protein product [Arctogadus glacialis]